MIILTHFNLKSHCLIWCLKMHPYASVESSEREKRLLWQVKDTNVWEEWWKSHNSLYVTTYLYEELRTDNLRKKIWLMRRNRIERCNQSTSSHGCDIIQLPSKTKKPAKRQEKLPGNMGSWNYVTTIQFIVWMVHPWISTNSYFSLVLYSWFSILINIYEKRTRMNWHRGGGWRVDKAYKFNLIASNYVVYVQTITTPFYSLLIRSYPSLSLKAASSSFLFWKVGYEGYGKYMSLHTASRGTLR